MASSHVQGTASQGTAGAGGAGAGSDSAAPAGKATQYAPAERVGRVAPSMWDEFSGLARKSGRDLVNLGLGFPNWETPDFVKEAACAAIMGNENQYCRSAGHIPFVEAVARRYSKELGREVDPLAEVTVGVGACECLYSSMQSLVNPGDGVLMVAPTFDIYLHQIKLAGGVPQLCPLRVDGGAKKWTLDIDELERCITSKTRILLLNTPHNPTGKVFTRAELEAIAEVVKRHPDIVVVADEVYEYIVFDDNEHVHIASLPGMWERTLTITSLGKTFSATGWKVGTIVGPAHLIKGVCIVNQGVMFSVATPLCAAAANMLAIAETPYKGYDTYYKWLQVTYSKKRDQLVAGLRSAGLEPIMPEGTFFMLVDTSSVDIPEEYLKMSTPACPEMTRDWAFCRYAIDKKRVMAIPPKSFYGPELEHLAANYARFAFCKTDKDLDAACAKFEAWRENE